MKNRLKVKLTFMVDPGIPVETGITHEIWLTAETLNLGEAANKGVRQKGIGAMFSNYCARFREKRISTPLVP